MGSHILLRAWRETDLPFLHTLRNDFETQRLLLAEPRPQSQDQVRSWLGDRTSRHDQVFFVVAERESQDPVGFVELRGIQPVHRWGMLGICLAREVRRRGWGREALSLLEQYAQDTLGLRKIVLHVLASHPGASPLYEEAGYRRIGIHTGHYQQGGAFHDVAVMEKVLSRAAVGA